MSALKPGPSDRPGNRRIVSALRRAQRTFTVLSDAARRGSASRYRRAAREVGDAVAGLDRAIGALRSAGYTVRAR
jgi:hypothetical protein